MATGPDSGLQAERTAMAWQRTALGAGGVSALLLHDAQGDPLRSAPGVAGLLAAVTLLLVVEARYLRMQRHEEEVVNPMGPHLVRALATGAVLLAAAAVVVVLGSAG